MCATCGCGQNDVRVTPMGDPVHVDHLRRRQGHDLGSGHLPDHEHDHDHDHLHDHSHDLDHPQDHDHRPPDRSHTLTIQEAILAKNDHLAEHNRAWLTERSIVAVNVMSSPGAGKTSLLERTIRDGRAGRPVAVVEGDQETLFDAERIRAAGAKAVQINTGAGCHLDAGMVRNGLQQLQPGHGDMVFLENVGNLVCPAMFDLGELKKVVIVSVTEGDDKPLKYPHMFAAADLVVVNKTDLLPYVDFDMDRCEHDARQLNPDVGWMPISVRDGDNLEGWYSWLRHL